MNCDETNEWSVSVCVCAANNQNCSQMDSGIGDVCTLPLDRTMMHSRFMENGHLSKVVPVKPPAVERFPIKVEDLEDYVMSRRNNNNEELRNEYRVRIVDCHGGKPVYPSVCLSVCLFSAQYLEKSMQLGSPNLTYKCFMMSPGNLFILH